MLPQLRFQTGSRIASVPLEVFPPPGETLRMLAATEEQSMQHDACDDLWPDGGHAQWLHTLARRMCRAWEDPDDLVQNGRPENGRPSPSRAAKRPTRSCLRASSGKHWWRHCPPCKPRDRGSARRNVHSAALRPGQRDGHPGLGVRVWYDAIDRRGQPPQGVNARTQNIVGESPAKKSVPATTIIPLLVVTRSHGLTFNAPSAVQICCQR